MMIESSIDELKRRVVLWEARRYDRDRPYYEVIGCLLPDSVLGELRRASRGRRSQRIDWLEPILSGRVTGINLLEWRVLNMAVAYVVTYDDRLQKGALDKTTPMPLPDRENLENEARLWCYVMQARARYQYHRRYGDYNTSYRRGARAVHLTVNRYALLMELDADCRRGSLPDLCQVLEDIDPDSPVFGVIGEQDVPLPRGLTTRDIAQLNMQEWQDLTRIGFKEGETDDQ